MSLKLGENKNKTRIRLGTLVAMASTLSVKNVVKPVEENKVQSVERGKVEGVLLAPFDKGR
jgi:hypothetical protein